MAKVLILTGDGAEALEVYYPYQRLQEAGHSPTIAAPEVKTLQLVMHDFVPGFDTYTEKPGYRIETDVSFGDVKPEEYDALLLPGGRAPEWIRNKSNCLNIVRHFFEANKPVASICHGQLILVAAGLLRGRTATAYFELEPDIKAAGGMWQNQEVVVDGKLVTSRAWPDHPGFMREFLKLLG